MDHLDKIFLEFMRMKEWKLKEYQTFSVHNRSYENYLRLQDQLNHILKMVHLKLDIELLNIDGYYIQMFLLSSKNDMNYLLRVNDEEFMTYLDGKVYILNIPDQLMFDHCKITYNGEEDILVSVSSTKDEDGEKIAIQLNDTKNNTTSLIVPWDKKYSRFATGSTQSRKVTELYLYDDKEIKVKYYSKEMDHVVDISFVLGYFVNTQQLHSITYKYEDSKHPAYNIDEKYVANVQEKAMMLMNTLKKDPYIENFMVHLNDELKLADPKLYKMIEKEYPLIVEFVKHQKAEKIKTLKYVN